MVTTLGKLRAAWRIFFLCPGSVIPTSLRSWSSITLFPCMWRHFKRHKQINHIQTHSRPHTHARVILSLCCVYFLKTFFSVYQEFHKLSVRLFSPHVILCVTHNCLNCITWGPPHEARVSVVMRENTRPNPFFFATLIQYFLQGAPYKMTATDESISHPCQRLNV